MELEELSLKEKETLIVLLKKNSTIEEIQAQARLSFTEARDAVRELLKKKLVKKTEFPTRYSLGAGIKKKVSELKERLDWSELQGEEKLCRVK
ncbi:MAG: hypothetical protein AB1467_04690 [Candidatus Diapherotrites archaeon]